MRDTRPAVIFVNRFAPPDISATSQLLGGLLNGLSCDGAVHVVTGRVKYDDPSTLLPKVDRLGSAKLHRVWTSRFGRSRLWGRAVDYLTFYVSAAIKVLLLARRGSIIVAMTDPPMISIPLSWVSRVRGARLVNWLQDLFPEVASNLGIRMGKATFALLQELRDRSLQVATLNVAIGRRMADLVQSRVPGARTVVIPNWSPTEDIVPCTRSDNPLAAAWGIGAEFVVAYSGNLGRAHDLSILIDAAAILRDRSDIVIMIVGEGVQKGSLMERAGRMGLTNVRFHRYQSTELLKYSLTLPDVHIVSLKPELEGLIVPSKFYSSIAAGKPVIFIGAADGELADCIQGLSPCGVVVRSHRAGELATAILGLEKNRDVSLRMGLQARRMYLNEYATAKALERWELALRGVRSS